MNYTEQPTLFPCEGETLLGILSLPQTPAETGVVIVVGGPQYRAGSHRQFVLLARKLAGAGYPVLRFDYRGMGDSTGDPRDFQGVSMDIDAAINILQESQPSVRKVILWGLCDGASAALLYCHETQDPRVSGLCLLNPWVRSELSLARTQVKYYYKKRLMQSEFWIKLLSGRVAWQALVGLIGNMRVAATGAGSGNTIASTSNRSASPQDSYQQRMAAAWVTFSGGILLLLSTEDYTAKEFLEYASKDAAWKDALAHPVLMRHDLQGADHTFSNAASRAIVGNLNLAWLERLANGSSDDRE